MHAPTLQEVVMENLRYLLRAYEDSNACRLARLLRDHAAHSNKVSRDAVAVAWAERYPRHAGATGKGNVRGRISNGLSMLKAAGIAQANGDDILVLNATKLAMSADNLSIVEDENGMAVRPGLWTHRPQVPQELLAVQQQFEATRTAGNN